jgi:hypothetical protein
MSSLGAALRAAVPVSHARAEASRRNGAKSRGPRTPDGKARSSRNALKHGLRAATHVVLLDEDWDEFRALEGALLAELTPVGAVQAILVQRIAIATWRLARADRLEVEVLAFRAYAGATPGLALIRDGNGTRTIETLLRYRGAALAELTRSLRALQALQAAARAAAKAETPLETGVSPAALPRRAERTRPARHEAPFERAAGTRASDQAGTAATRPAARATASHRPEPNEPTRRDEAPVGAYIMPERPGPGHTLHEAAAPWTPNEPDGRGKLRASG